MSRPRKIGKWRPEGTPPERRQPRPEPEVRYVEAQPRRFNPDTAIALVFSLLWIFGIGALLGILGGISSVRKCQRENLGGEALGHIAWILGVLGMIPVVVFVLGVIAG